MAFEKVLSHPDYRKVVKMLNNGASVRDVNKWLIDKYKGDKEKILSIPTLQTFRKRHLSLDKEVISQIRQKEKEKQKEKQKEKSLKKAERKLRAVPSYQQKIEEAANLHIDIRTEFKELLVVVKTRVRDLFDKAERGELGTNEERNFVSHLSTWQSTIEKWAKYVDKIDNTTTNETNINITIIEDQMSIMRDTIYELLHEMEPEFAIKFLDVLNNKFKQLSYRKGKQHTFEGLHNHAKVLKDAIVDGE